MELTVLNLGFYLVSGSRATLNRDCMSPCSCLIGRNAEISSMEISQQRKSWIWGIPNHVKYNVLKKASKCAENKTTSRQRAGHIFSECVLWAWWRAQSKREGKQRKREKLFRNQLGIVCSYQNTLLTQTCHGANICSQLSESVQAGWVSLAQEHQELTWHDGRKWEELLKAPVSKTGRKLVPLMRNLFILICRKTCRFFFPAERHLFQHGKWEKKPDSGHLTHMVVSAKANGGLHMASLETWGSLTLWHWIITILWS